MHVFTASTRCVLTSERQIVRYMDIKRALEFLANMITAKGMQQNVSHCYGASKDLWRLVIVVKVKELATLELDKRDKPLPSPWSLGMRSNNIQHRFMKQ